MRIPFPTRISLFHSSAFAIILCAAQLLEGTPLYFCLYSFLFISIATLAFNVVGGLSRPSGGYIFFYAVLAVIFGLVCKAFFGERADSHLLDPHTTMLAYVGSISAMYVAALLAHRLVPKRPLLEGLTRPNEWGAASIGCIVIGIALFFYDVMSTQAQGVTAASQVGSVVSTIRQLNRFLPLGVLLGTMYTIRKSGGRRLLSIPVILGVLFMLVYYGIIETSKEGLFTPVLCVLLAAAACRYKFSAVQMTSMLLAAFISVGYLVPYIQYGKGQESTTLGGRVEFAITSLLNPSSFINFHYQVESYEEENDFVVHYYDKPHGFLDRLQLISIDDALIDVTDQGHVFGLFPVLFGFENIVPHFIWKNKPVYPFGNMFAHEIGYAHFAKDSGDDTTGISFSPTADAFHEARWTGVLLVAPAIWLLTFFIMDWASGDTRRSPWGLLLTVLCAHQAPEGGLQGPIYLLSFAMVAIFLAALMVRYVLPIVATLVTGYQSGMSSSKPRLRHVRSLPAILHESSAPDGSTVGETSS